MSMWQFFSMIAGQADGGKGLSSEEADDIWDWLQADPAA